MRANVLALGAVVAVVIGLTLTFAVERSHAAQSPADECWTGPAPIGGTACEHVFRDGSKCVVFAREGAGSASLQCKIT